jgi:hypothetical protein
MLTNSHIEKGGSDMTGYVHMGIGNAKKMASDLENINGKMQNLLRRLPLREQRDIAELSRLAESQNRLLKTEIPDKKIPMKEVASLHKEIDLAYALKERYTKALSRGSIRG